MKIKTVFTVAIATLVTTLVKAETITISSGLEKNQFVELYTSEGCSSCPPADKWLSKLKNDPRLWNDIVPIAFHVDYWDRLGWKDELARQDYSQRQRQYREQGGLSQVYTPGFVVDGQEWRGFFKRKNLAEFESKLTGELIANVTDESVVIEFNPQIKTKDTLLVHIATLGFDIENEIQAGENRGKTLTHDFAVLAYRADEVNLNENKYNLTMTLPPVNVNAPQKALVIWVSDVNSQLPLQVAGNWL